MKFFSSCAGRVTVPFHPSIEFFLVVVACVLLYLRLWAILDRELPHDHLIIIVLFSVAAPGFQLGIHCLLLLLSVLLLLFYHLLV